MEELSTLFQIFHDGSIEDFVGDFTNLELQISCTYLAEMEEKGNEYFYLTVTNVELLEFHCWNGKVVKNLENILKLGVEIGYSKIEDGIIKISCHTWEYKDEGELWMIANYKALETEKRRWITPKILGEWSAQDWDKFNKRDQ